MSRSDRWCGGESRARTDASETLGHPGGEGKSRNCHDRVSSWLSALVDAALAAT